MRAEGYRVTLKLWILCLFSAANLHGFSFPKIALPSLTSFLPGNQYRTYREIEKSKLSAQQLRKILCVYALPEDERLLYENIFQCLSKKFQEPDLSSGFLTKLLNEKIELLSAVEDFNGKEREQLLLQLIAQNLYKFSIMEDAEIKTAIKKLERKNLRLLMKVIKYFYEEIPLAQTLIDQKKLEQNYKKLNDASIGQRIEDIKNSKLDQQQKKIEYAKLRQIVELTVLGNATVILWDRWKQQLFNQTHSWFTAVKDRTTPQEEKLNVVQQKQQKKFLQQAQVDYKKELNKYILIERGDHILKEYNEFCIKKSSELKHLENLAKKNQEPVQQQWENINNLFDRIQIEANFSLNEFQKQWRRFVVNAHPDKINAKENHQNAEANTLVMQNANAVKPIVESIMLSRPRKVFNRYLIRQDWLKENSVDENYSNEQLIEYGEKFTKFVQEVGIEAQKNEVNNKWQEERKRIDFLIRNNNRVLTYDLPPIKPYNLGIKSVPQLKLSQSELQRMEYEQLWSFWNQYFPNQTPRKPKRNKRTFSELLEITQNTNNELNENQNDDQH